MRILYFSRDCTPHDHRFLTALSKTEHQVYFLRLEKSPLVYEDRPLPAEIKTVDWRGGKHRIKLYDQLHLLEDLRRVINKIKPDLIHAGPIQRAAFLTALTGYRPLVSMSWGYDLLHDANINPFWGWATRYTLRRSAAFVGDCNTIRKLAVSYGMPEKHIVTFPWGVDIEHFNIGTLEPSSKEPSDGRRLNGQTSLEKTLARQAFNLLSTRSFEPIYGVDVIARAFGMAAKKCPQLHLTMLGNGSQETAIRQIFSHAGVSDRVEFKGPASYAELPAYYRAADMYISASHSDGSSISLLEAFACGTPAIVSDIPGNREWVTPGENGWLFPDGDAEALAEALLNAFEQRQSLVRMGVNARQLAEARANWEVNFPKLEHAYKLAMDDFHNGGALGAS